MSITEQQREAGRQVALEMFKRAYAPYSKFQVGAALKLKGSEQWVGGHNIENASFGGTVCAERVAVFASLSQHNVKEFDALVLITNTETGDIPCALCLQILSEFVSPELPIYCYNLKELKRTLRFRDLLPMSFDRGNLP